MSDLILALQRAGFATLDMTGKDQPAVEALLVYCDETEAADGHARRSSYLRSLVGKPAEGPTWDDLRVAVITIGGRTHVRILPKADMQTDAATLRAVGATVENVGQMESFPLSVLFAPLPTPVE